MQARLVAPTKRRKRTLALVLWLSAPLAAAAAIMFAFLSVKPTPPARLEAPVTHVDYVVTGDPTASTMVYVDEDSGWLVVWAESAPIGRNG